MCHLEEEKKCVCRFSFFSRLQKASKRASFWFSKKQPLATTCSLFLQPLAACCCSHVGQVSASGCKWLQVAAAVCSGSEPFAAVCYLEKSDFVDVCRFYFFFKIVCSGGLAASRHLAAATCPDWNICINGCFDQKSFTGPDCLYLRVSVYLQPANWRPVK